MKKRTRIIIVFLLLSGIYSRAALESGTYETIFSSTVLEMGDYVPNGRRVLPRSAKVIFDMDSAPLSLTAVLSNAVLEGEQPFELTVRSSSGTQLSDGSYRFTGDYLQDTFPELAGYFSFNWEFTAMSNGIVIWDGITGFNGSHIWAEIISGLTLQVNPPTYHAEPIFIENPSFENDLIGWEDGVLGEIHTYSQTYPPECGFGDGTNMLVFPGGQGTPYRSQTLDAVVRSNSVYVLEVFGGYFDGIIALQDGSSSTLVEYKGPKRGGEYSSTDRLIYAAPAGHESIGMPLKIHLGNLCPYDGTAHAASYDNVRLTRYYVSPSLMLKLADGDIVISATNLVQGIQYEISSVATLTNAWTQVLTFNAEDTSTNFTGLIPTNAPSAAGFYKLEWDE